MKRIFIFILLVLCMFAGTFQLFASGQEEKAEGKSSEKKINFNLVAAQWMLQKFPVEASVKRYMKDHPNVNIVVEGYQDYSLSTHLLNWSTGDSGVDLSFGGTAGQVARLAAKDLLMPLNDFYTGEFDKNEFVLPLVENAKSGGDYYAIPVMMEGMMIPANKKLLEEAGFVKDGNPIGPKTLDELYEYTKKLTKGSGEVKDIYGFSWNFSNFGDLQPFSLIHALGGKAYNDDGSANIYAPEFKQIFEFIKNGASEGYHFTGTITDTNSARSAFFGGNIAMIFESSSRGIEGRAQLGDACTVIPLPDQRKNGGYVFAHYIYAPKESKNKETIISYLQEQVFTPWFAHEIPAMTYGKHPVMKKLWDGLPAIHEPYKKLLLDPTNITDKGWYDGAKLNQVLYSITQALATTNMTPDEAVAILREEGEKLNLKVIK